MTEQWLSKANKRFGVKYHRSIFSSFLTSSISFFSLFHLFCLSSFRLLPSLSHSSTVLLPSLPSNFSVLFYIHLHFKVFQMISSKKRWLLLAMVMGCKYKACPIHVKENQKFPINLHGYRHDPMNMCFAYILMISNFPRFSYCNT